MDSLQVTFGNSDPREISNTNYIQCDLIGTTTEQHKLPIDDELLLLSKNATGSRRWGRFTILLVSAVC